MSSRQAKSPARAAEIKVITSTAARVAERELILSHLDQQRELLNVERELLAGRPMLHRLNRAESA